MTKKVIPIQNIFYLFCYAWNRYQEGEIISIKQLESPGIADLFAKILINGTNHILRRGLDRGYVETNEDSSCIRGKLSIDTSIKRNLFLNAKANCSFDELTHDVLHNQIIKTTIYKVSKVKGLDKTLRNPLLLLGKRLDGIQQVVISNSLFRRIQLNRNNAYYDFLLKVCELIHNIILPQREDGSYSFKDILQNERLMNRVFEDFLRNFYKIEQNEFSVSSEYINWDGVSVGELAQNVLPSMLTDVSLRGKDRTIIIDAKYYKEALPLNRGKERIRSSHLYQLFAYLKNLKHDAPGYAEGVLLYPTVNKDFNYEYVFQGHRVRACSINLNQDWQRIHKDLISVIA